MLAELNFLKLNF